MDLADQIDDYICSFEGIGDLTMDSLAMFVFIWAVMALFLLWLCKFVYNRFLKKDKAASAANSRQGSIAPVAKTDAKRLSEPKEILATKNDIREIASKAASLTGSARGRSGSGSVTPGGGGSSLRKRMVRQSSTGPENIRKRYVPPPSNVVGPETTSVTWTSLVFRWLYGDLVIVNELLITWVIALNETLKKVIQDPGLSIEIVRVLPDSPAPGLHNIFCNAEESNPADMLITFDCDAMPVLQVKTIRQKPGKVDVSHYKVTVSRFRARLALAMNYNSLKGDMRVDGYPDIRITMNSVGAIKPMDQDEQQLQETISDILSNALRETIYPVDFSVHATCPRAEEPVDLPVIYNYPVHYDAFANYDAPSTAPKRLLVKIVKGDGLKDAREAYVIVEMDEPAQKNQTMAIEGHNPHWDEHFLFDLAPQSAEILFEVYNNPPTANDPPQFLGLALVGIDELSSGLATSQVLTLQPRPYETQPVYGSITVDFVFIERPDLPGLSAPRSQQAKEALRINSPTINEHMRNGVDLAEAAVRALQDGALTTSNGTANRSTVIIHSVQRVPLSKDETPQNPADTSTSESITVDINSVQDISSASGNIDTTAEISKLSEDTSARSTDEATSPSESFAASVSAQQPDDSQTGAAGNTNELEASVSEFGHPNATSSPNGLHNNYQLNGNGNGNTNNNAGGLNNYNTNSLTRNGSAIAGTSSAFGANKTNNNAVPSSSSTNINNNILDDDDRGRSKKRNFFGTLKKRLSRSKTRTQSVDQPNAQALPNNNGTTPTGTLNGDSRSLSVDRGVISKSNSLVPRMGAQALDHSRRSSISESSAISGFSSGSNKTYVHEASTLVLETLENGITRHFVVPHSIAQRPKWRRKGTKLHIYNDHTFVAKHLSGGGLLCAICMKSIPRRPGKQGYECRDCQMICHKQCHVRAPQACPNPTVLSMELSHLPVLREEDVFY